MIDEMDINMLTQSVESLAPTKIKKNNKILFKISANNSIESQNKELTGTISQFSERKGKGAPTWQQISKSAAELNTVTPR